MNRKIKIISIILKLQGIAIIFVRGNFDVMSIADYQYFDDMTTIFESKAL